MKMLIEWIKRGRQRGVFNGFSMSFKPASFCCLDFVCPDIAL